MDRGHRADGRFRWKSIFRIPVDFFRFLSYEFTRWLDAATLGWMMGGEPAADSSVARVSSSQSQDHTTLMNPRIFAYVALASLAVLINACTPYPEKGPKKGPQQQGQKPPPTPEEQQKIKEDREKAKKEAEEKQKQEAANNQSNSNNPGPTEGTKPKSTEKKDYPFASPVVGKAGFVLSPYNSKMVDVRDIPSGTLVQDPTYPASEKKYFRVP